MDFEPAHPSNFRVGRNHPVDTIVVHTTEATLASAVGWFGMDHAGYKMGPTSAHYVLGHDGRCVACVPESDTAFHAGNFSYNLRSIGIECEGFAASPDTWTDRLVYALVELIADISKRHGFVPTRTNVIGHAEVPDPAHTGQLGGVGHNVDPGPHIPWERIMLGLDARLNTKGVA
jgi:N-acetyl-anhydromuramyl-L-alanine amidase AmpD